MDPRIEHTRDDSGLNSDFRPEPKAEASAPVTPSSKGAKEEPEARLDDLSFKWSDDDGLARHFERRPGERLFGQLFPEIIDASSTTRERAVDDLKIFRIQDVFKGDRTVFLGFGMPNVYTVCPDAKGGYQKFAGKSLYRQPSTVQDTRNLVQSGVQIHFKNLPDRALERLREAMAKHDGRKFLTCVKANSQVLEDAGFSCGPTPLGKYRFPVTFLGALRKHGLQFEGQKVEYEIVRTTPTTLGGFGAKIAIAELMTPFRHAKRKLRPILRNSRIWNALKSIRGKKKAEPWKPKPVAPKLPDGVNYESDLKITVSQPSTLGMAARLFWGAHNLFEVKQDRVAIEKHLPDKLKEFPQEKPSLFTRLKKGLLFSRPVIYGIRQVLCPKPEPLPGESSERNEAEVYDMLRTHTPETPNKYNIVITGDRIIVARLGVKFKLIDWILSKHVLVSGYDDDVRFAGEVWKDRDGRIHISRDSGTYQPSEEQQEGAVACAQEIFPNWEIVKESRG